MNPAISQPVVAVVAYSPAPYRVEFFDEVSRRNNVSLRVHYVHRREPGRDWVETPLRHQAHYLHEPSAQNHAQDADLVVISYFSDSAASALWRHARVGGKPWVFWGERPGAHQRGWLGRFLRLWRLRHLHRSQAPVWAIGSWAADAYRDEFGRIRPVENLPYYSDLTRFSQPSSRRSRVSGRRRILFSGRLIARKGVDLLMRAFESVAARHPGVTLTLAGAGDLENELRQRIAARSLPASVHGFALWDALPGLYASHDILVVPSRYDGWGMVVPEGLASGLPVLATDRMGAAHDLIEPGKNGWITRAGDFESLAQALEKAASMDDLTLDAMSAAASRSVASHQLRDGAEKFERLSRAALGLA